MTSQSEIKFIQSYKASREGKNDTELTVTQLMAKLMALDPKAIIELDWNIGHMDNDKTKPLRGYVSLTAWTKQEYEVLIEDEI